MDAAVTIQDVVDVLCQAEAGAEQTRLAPAAQGVAPDREAGEQVAPVPPREQHQLAHAKRFNMQCVQEVRRSVLRCTMATVRMPRAAPVATSRRWCWWSSSVEAAAARNQAQSSSRPIGPARRPKTSATVAAKETWSDGTML